VPVIRHLLQSGHHPVVAGNASQLSFINHTFDGAVSTVALEGYNVTYSGWNRFAQAGLLAQLPSIRSAIDREHEWLKAKAVGLKLDGIISDNRYGLYHHTIPSAIITHQLQLMTGFGRIADRLVQKYHYSYLRRFNETWVPDAAGITNLGGRLSHPARLPEVTRYLGLLSRFAPRSPLPRTSSDELIVILLSGPEPQRSNLSRIIWQQALQLQNKMVIIEGAEDAQVPANIPSNIVSWKRLTETELVPILQQATMVICRSGYSTIMDLLALGKKAILIPTPGQTEQQYLADELHCREVFYTTGQAGFSLAASLQAAASFPFQLSGLGSEFNNYEPVIDDWLKSL
jgi:UDP:flavonoid glycosyltransferase YjiC (YdhE family)